MDEGNIKQMGGYADDVSQKVDPSDAVALLQSKHLREAAALRALLDSCDEGRPCTPAIEHLANFRQQLRLIKDQDIQIVLVQAYVNLRGVYDYVEADVVEKDIDHHPLIEAATNGLYICDENARLKLFLYSEIGIPQSRLRWVGEDSYELKVGKENDGGHAVLELSVRHKIFALENFDVWDNGPRYTASWEQLGCVLNNFT